MKLAGPEAVVGGIEDRTLPGPAGPLAVRIYTPPMPDLRYCRGWSTSTAAAWWQAPWRRTTPSDGRSRILALAEWSRSNTAWPPSTHFPPRSTTPWRRSRISALTPHASVSTAHASVYAATRRAARSRRRQPSGRSNRQPAAGVAIADLPDSRLQPLDGFQTGPRQRLFDRSGHARSRPSALRAARNGSGQSSDLAPARGTMLPVCRARSYTRRNSIRCATKAGIISSALPARILMCPTLATRV